jgi:hypothetical protein
MPAQPLFESNLDATKRLDFDVDAIGTATTRVAIWPDRNVDIGDVGFKSEENVWTRIQRYPVDTISFASAVSVSATAGSGERKMTLTGDVTSFTVTDLAEGAYLVIDLFQDAIGGRTVAFTGIDGIAPTIESAPNARTSVVVKGLASSVVFVEGGVGGGGGVTPLSDGHIFVGNVSNVAVSVPMTGQVAISNTGVTTVQPALDTQVGVVELATAAEAVAVVDATRATTPLSLAGLIMATPIRQTYTETNVTTRRTIDADAETLQNLADVLATLIGDLRVKGIVD